MLLNREGLHVTLVKRTQPLLKDNGSHPFTESNIVEIVLKSEYFTSKVLWISHQPSNKISYRCAVLMYVRQVCSAVAHKTVLPTPFSEHHLSHLLPRFIKGPVTIYMLSQKGIAVCTFWLITSYLINQVGFFFICEVSHSVSTSHHLHNHHHHHHYHHHHHNDHMKGAICRKRSAISWSQKF